MPIGPLVTLRYIGDMGGRAHSLLQPSLSKPSLLKPGLWLVGGATATSAIAAADLLSPETAVPMLAIALGPFVAAFGASTPGTALVAGYTVAVGFGIGAIDDQLGSGSHTGRMIALAVLGTVAVVATDLRVRRDAELAAARPAAHEAQRLRIALDAGNMGTWSWDRDSGRVEWDSRLEPLFGVPAGGFTSTFAAWVESLHPDDRERVVATFDDSIRRVVPFRYDHRVTWADGSVHWVEGRGEPVVGASGQVVGAAGVAINIDERRNSETERLSLLEAERQARTAAERSGTALRRLTDLTLALSGAATLDDVAAAAVKHGAAALHARHGWFAMVEEDAETLVTLAHEGYPPELIEPYLAVPLDAPLPATEALRTGGPIFIESHEDRRRRFPQFPETGVHGSFVVVPIAHGEGARGVLSFGYPDARPFSDEDRRYIAAVIEACTQALRRAALFEAELRSRGRLRTLLDLSEALAGLDDPDAVLVTTARFAADRVGRFASVYVAEAEGLRRVASVHADPALDAICNDIAELGFEASEIALRAAANDEIVVTRTSEREWRSLPVDAQRLMAVLQPTAMMVLPMRVSGRTRGVLVIGHDRPAGFAASDVELATDVGRRTASAHERATLWRASQQKFEAEHQMVEVLQRSIVPDQLPEVAGTELAAVYRPADVTIDVGGDWYDVFERDGAIMLIVGDVAGHGVEAATLMARVRNAMRAYAAEDDDPGTLLARVDRLLHTFEEQAMVTAVVARYEPATGIVAWSRAGHLPPLLCDGGGGTRFLDDVNSPPLGTLAHGFETARARLGPGSLLVLYTDGLVERRDCVLDDGLDWLANRVRETHAQTLTTLCRLLADDPFVPHPSGDDICVLAIRAATG